MENRIVNGAPHFTSIWNQETYLFLFTLATSFLFSLLLFLASYLLNFLLLFLLTQLLQVTHNELLLLEVADAEPGQIVLFERPQLRSSDSVEHKGVPVLGVSRIFDEVSTLFCRPVLNEVPVSNQVFATGHDCVFLVNTLGVGQTSPPNSVSSPAGRKTKPKQKLKNKVTIVPFLRTHITHRNHTHRNHDPYTSHESAGTVALVVFIVPVIILVVIIILITVTMT